MSNMNEVKVYDSLDVIARWNFTDDVRFGFLGSPENSSPRKSVQIIYRDCIQKFSELESLSDKDLTTHGPST